MEEKEEDFIVTNFAACGAGIGRDSSPHTPCADQQRTEFVDYYPDLSR